MNIDKEATGDSLPSVKGSKTPKKSLMLSNATDDEVFVYTGPGGERVPDDVVRIRVYPSVMSIQANAFRGRKKLAEVDHRPR